MLIARNAGFVSSAYFLGAFVGSNVWGVLSDILGRRPVIIACTAISAAAAIGFGLARNLIWAIVARIVTGEKMGKGC